VYLRNVLLPSYYLSALLRRRQRKSYWYNGDYGLKQWGYYGTPYGGGPQYSSGGGDQYGYGPAYSYAKQAPEPSPFAPPPCVWRRVWNGHHWVRSCI
jgi:hypothetical protein